MQRRQPLRAFFPLPDGGAADTSADTASDASSAGDAPLADAAEDTGEDSDAGMSDAEEDTRPADDTGSSDVETDTPGRPAWRDQLPTPPAFDCPDEPIRPTSARRLRGARGYHGLVFDDDGYLYGWDGSSIIRATSDGDASLWLPNVDSAEQMDRLEGGDIVVGTWGGLLRITPDRFTQTLAPDLDIYGIEVAPDGYVYAAGDAGVWRIDPDSGAYETILRGRDDFLPHTVTFNQDYTRIFVGVVTWGDGFCDDWDDDNCLEGTEVVAWDVDDNLNPIGEQIVYAEDVGGGYHDALKFDICGNLYVSDFDTASLYRIDPDGDVVTLIDWGDGDGPLGDYGHAMMWGPGHSGWRADAAYFPLPYSGEQVQEIVLGIPSVRWDGTGREAFD